MTTQPWEKDVKDFVTAVLISLCDDEKNVDNNKNCVTSLIDDPLNAAIVRFRICLEILVLVDVVKEEPFENLNNKTSALKLYRIKQKSLLNFALDLFFKTISWIIDGTVPIIVYFF